MAHKWIGAVLVVVTSGGFGMMYAWNQIREERLLAQVAEILDYMESQLAYRLTPLPELCEEVANFTPGILGQVFARLQYALELRVSPEVSNCMEQAIADERPLPPAVSEVLLSLGKSLGRFDLTGQRKELLTLRGECRRQLQNLRRNRGERLRAIRTLGFCAGAALTILLI